jgi:hypothetical protein
LRREPFLPGELSHANGWRQPRPALPSFINALVFDEQVDLVTLAWIGRGDGTIEDWNELRTEAARVHNNRTARYLLGLPLLSDYLQEGLSQFGRSCSDFEKDHL